MLTKEEYIAKTQKELLKLYTKCVQLHDFLYSCITKNMLPDHDEIKKITYDYYPYGDINDNAKSCDRSLKSSSFFDIKEVKILHSKYISLHGPFSKNEMESNLSDLNALKQNTKEVYLTLENAKTRASFINDNKISLWNLASIYNIIIQCLEICISSDQRVSKSNLYKKFNLQEFFELEFKLIIVYNSLESFQMSSNESIEFTLLNDIDFKNAQESLKCIKLNKSKAKMIFDLLNEDIHE